MTDTLERLESIVSRLEALGLAPGVDLAAINSDGSPGTVAAGELIESQWGNATANTIGKLKTTQRYAAALSLPLVTVDTGGTFVSGALSIPTAPYRRIVVVTACVLITASGDIDLQMLSTGAVIMRKVRRPTVAGNGASLLVTTQSAIAANAAEQYAIKLAAVGGTVQVQVLGGPEFNYVDAVVVPTLST